MIEHDFTCAQRSPVPKGQVRDDGARWVSIWRRTLILAAVLSLAINVATRYTTVVQLVRQQRS